MINHDRPFIPPDEDPVADPTWIEVHVSTAGHPHIGMMLEQKVELVRVHAMMHLFGSENSPAHEECLQRLEALQPDIERAWSAIWN